MSKRLSAVIKHFREQMGMSQNGLARSSGLSVGYISRLEGGEYRSVTVENLAKIAKALQVDIGRLLVEKEHDGYVRVRSDVPLHPDASDVGVLAYMEFGYKKDEPFRAEICEEMIEDAQMGKFFEVVEKRLNRGNSTKMYKTSDLNLATVFFYFKHKIQDVVPVDDKRMEFVFEDTQELRDLEREYYDKDVQIEPRAFFHHLKDMKTLMADQRMNLKKTGKGIFESRRTS